MLQCSATRLLSRYDHIYGVFITAAGKRRRLDIILVPRDSLAMAVCGWTGSKQYLRFMRTHAGNCAMLLNSHYMFRRAPGTNLGVLVPQEAPPLDQNRREFWPPGWDAKDSGKPRRQIETERDLWELLQLPYLEPHERNCP